MRIINCGRGVHRREVVGVAKLQSLPSHWYAYTNLDLAVSQGKSREIDVIMVADDRIFLLDLKDWGGRIASQDGRWLHNGRDCGPSPVNKLHQNAKDIVFLLKSHLQKHQKGQKVGTPLIQALVVITARADISEIAATEAGSVIHIDDFVKAVMTPGARVKSFGPVSRVFVDHPLTSQDWKQLISSFFNVETGLFKPGKRNYGGFVAASDAATFEHPRKIYAEYDAADQKTAHTFGTLRIWDFTKADARFQSEEGRTEIAGRERDVIAYLRDRSEDCEHAILQHKVEDPDRGVSYWEVYDRRQRMRRFSDFVTTEAAELSRDGKIELARQILLKANALHLADAAHLDVGAHSIWLQQPSTVRLSHLMAASYPQVRSLGETRYQFLASADVPEDVLGGGADAKRKDVFLLGVVLHHLLFARPPASEDKSMPPEWSPAVDPDGGNADLHSWFEQALALSPADRFPNAGAALDAFNAAIASKPSAKEVIEGLEQFRTSIRSQMQLFGALPPLQPMRDDTYRAAWKSRQAEQDVFVKMWKRACWGDQVREGPHILDFLNRARDLQRSPRADSPAIRDVIWLGDAIVLVQDWVDGPTLEESLRREAEVWGQADVALRFLRAVTERVIALHDLGMAHGDLKPQNILVAGESEHRPILVDLIDFGAADDGEIRSSAYAPPEGGRYERDRYALTKISEEVLAASNLSPPVAADIQRAIAECRTNAPANGTVLPLLDALDRALTAPALEERPSVRLSVRQAETGPVLADEGLFYLRRAPDRTMLFIRGACEEIEIEFNDRGDAFRGRRKAVDQKYISRVSKYDFMSVPLDVTVTGSTFNDFEELRILTEREDFLAGWNQAAQTPARGVKDEDEAPSPETFGDAAEDALIEAVVREPVAHPSPDVASLWRRLIDAENELTTEGVATSESSYRRDVGRHVAPFDLDCGSFDFRRDDRVLVERLDPRGQWRRIGYLDIARSKPEFIVFDTARFGTPNSDGIVDEDQRLRFTSYLEETSRQRRSKASDRILSRQSRIPDLIDVFDPNGGKLPVAHRTGPDPAILKGLYGLNDRQASSLSDLITLRPVGLLQGPPGTGKTDFIAALVHYALTHDLVQNVLLASQSHEAVNNAGEAVLKLFAKNKEKPSILRVGHEGVVSDRLLPFHTARVEELHKDRFRGSMRDRLRIGGRALGLSGELIENLIYIETAIRPVASKIAALEGADIPDDARMTGLRATIRRQLESIGLWYEGIGDLQGDEIVTAAIETLHRLAADGSRASPDKIARFRGLARLARDYAGSVSTAQRSFEPFLAGTRQIVAGTCVGLGRSSLGLTTTPFDLVIVDEAARCTASELSVPIQAGRWIVLVGDHAQLEPQHKAEIIDEVAADVKTTRGEVLRSDFERVFQTPYGKRAGRTLTKQYRMLPPIGRIVSSSFYNGALEHGRPEMKIDPVVLPSELEKPLLWVETDSLGEQAFQRSEQNGTSLTNPVEADLIVALLKRWSDTESFVQWLTTQTAYTHPIGIICTYAAQRDLVRKKFQFANLNVRLKSLIKIDTVDSYQGKENPIVVLSLVRNNAAGLQENGAATIREGFMSRPNRINVAVSRAMDRLVLVGAKQRWRSGGPMAGIAEAFDRETAVGEASVMGGAHLLPGGALARGADREARPTKRDEAKV